MLFPLLALDLLLSVMTDSIKAIHALLADEFLSKKFAIGIVNILENVEGRLAARFGRNLPMADSDLVVPESYSDFPMLWRAMTHPLNALTIWNKSLRSMSLLMPWSPK